MNTENNTSRKHKNIIFENSLKVIRGIETVDNKSNIITYDDFSKCVFYYNSQEGKMAIATIDSQFSNINDLNNHVNIFFDSLLNLPEEDFKSFKELFKFIVFKQEIPVDENVNQIVDDNEEV